MLHQVLLGCQTSNKTFCLHFFNKHFSVSNAVILYGQNLFFSPDIRWFLFWYHWSEELSTSLVLSWNKVISKSPFTDRSLRIYKYLVFSIQLSNLKFHEGVHPFTDSNRFYILHRVVLHTSWVPLICSQNVRVIGFCEYSFQLIQFTSLESWRHCSVRYLISQEHAEIHKSTVVALGT